MRARLRAVAETMVIVALVVTLAWSVTQRWRPVRVSGGSMRPALYPGDLAIVDSHGRMTAGRVVLLESARHGKVLHRAVEVGPDGSVRTQGDANPIADFDSTPASAVVGPVAAVVPVGRWLERWRGSAACDTMTAQQNSTR